MSHTTPMARIKTTWDCVEAAMLSHNPFLNKIELSRRPPRQFRDIYTKAIWQDFIRIYYSENGQYSFGIEYVYKDLPVDQWRVILSVGLRKITREPGEPHLRYDVVEKANMSFDEFKKLLRKVDVNNVNTLESLVKALLAQSFKQAVIQ